MHPGRQLNRVTNAMLDRYMEQLPLIAILRGITPVDVISVADILVEAGITMIEVPLNSTDACISVQSLAKRYRDEVLVGAGTVLSIDEVIAVQQAGAGLVVSPNTNTKVISETKRLGMVSIPGGCTPTEILDAIAAGGDAVKLFPAEMISPVTVTAIRAVLPPEFPLFAVGGIHAENMSDYIRHGINGFGIGSTLYRKGKSPAEVRQAADMLVSVCRNDM